MSKIAASFVLGLGFIFSALILSSAIVEVRSERTVFVRGLSEREVKADTVIWPIAFQVSGEELASVYASYQKSASSIGNFLNKRGFDGAEWRATVPEVTDKKAQGYSGYQGPRFVATGKVVVHTPQVDTVLSAFPETAELLGEGVTLMPNYQGPDFRFTGLNDIKPDMLAEATKSGREAAEKFAGDSGVVVGDLKTATQGLFSIHDRDPYTTHLKTVRVVTSMTFELEGK